MLEPRLPANTQTDTCPTCGESLIFHYEGDKRIYLDSITGEEITNCPKCEDYLNPEVRAEASARVALDRWRP